MDCARCVEGFRIRRYLGTPAYAAGSDRQFRDPETGHRQSARADQLLLTFPERVPLTETDRHEVWDGRWTKEMEGVRPWMDDTLPRFI